MAAWKMRRMERVGKVMLWARLVSHQRDEMNCYYFWGGKSFSKARPVWILDGGFYFIFLFYIYIYIYIYKNYEINRCQLFFFFSNIISKRSILLCYFLLCDTGFSHFLPSTIYHLYNH